MAYSDKVLEHYERPNNVGSLDAGSNDVGTGLVGAPECGDVMKLQIKVNEEGTIEDAKFKTFGCGSAIASSSLVTTMVIGKKIEEAYKIKNSDIGITVAGSGVAIATQAVEQDAAYWEVHVKQPGKIKLGVSRKLKSGELEGKIAEERVWAAEPDLTVGDVVGISFGQSDLPNLSFKINRNMKKSMQHLFKKLKAF